MATDSFTNSDGTALSTHNAAWTAFDSGLAPQGGGTITSNQAGMPTDFDAVGSYYSGSGSDSCQIVKKAGAALGNARAYVCVRASSTSLGYNIRLGDLSGDNFTSLTLYRHTTFLTNVTTLSISRLSDMTLRVRATENGGNQDIEAWVNGSQVTWSGGSIYTDSTAPIATGDPGFYLTNSGAKADSYFDDFDDLVAGGGVTVTDVDTDESITGEQTNVVITGTGFEAAQGAGIVELVDQDDTLTQEVSNYDSWADTSIQVDVTIGTSTGVRYGAGKVKVTNDSAASGELAVTITAPAGKNYVDLSTLAPGEDVDSIAVAQTYAAATPLSLEALAADIDPPRRASFTADSDESGTSFTIVGDDENGTPDSEIVVGPNNTTVYSDGYWSVIDSITPNATEGTDEIEVGQESLRLYTSPDMATGDQLEWSNVVGGAIGDVTVNNDGTFTADEAVTAFDFRVHNQTEGWGSIETQDVSSDNLAPTITTTTLPNGERETAYSQSIVATGDGTIVYSNEGISLPAGLSLNTANGAITGTPTESGVFNLTFGATSEFGFDGQDITLTIDAVVPSVTTLTLPDADRTQAYSELVAADGLPESWAVTVGALPDGLSINAGTGEISGTPTVAGTFNFTVEVTNVDGSDDQALAIEVLPVAPTVTAATLSDGYDTYPYSAQLTATGDPVDTWAVTVGALPSGLSLDAGTGIISGTPDTEETQAFTVEATNDGGSDTEDFEITILAASAYPVGTGARMRMRSLGLINRR